METQNDWKQRALKAEAKLERIKKLVDEVWPKFVPIIFDYDEE